MIVDFRLIVVTAGGSLKFLVNRIVIVISDKNE